MKRIFEVQNFNEYRENIFFRIYFLSEIRKFYEYAITIFALKYAK